MPKDKRAGAFLMNNRYSNIGGNGSTQTTLEHVPELVSDYFGTSMNLLEKNIERNSGKKYHQN